MKSKDLFARVGRRRKTSPIIGLLTGSGLFICLLFLSGCDFDFPVGNASNEAMDSRLIGEWKELLGPSATNRSGSLSVNRFSDSVFLFKYLQRLETTDESGEKSVQYTADPYSGWGGANPIFQAYRVDSSITNVLQLKAVDENGKQLTGRPYVVCLYWINGDDLRVLRINAPKEKLGSQAEVKRYIESAVKQQPIPAREYIFRRKTEAESAIDKQIAKLEAEIEKRKAAKAAIRSEQTQLQARSAMIGGGQWPPPGLRFKSAGEWQNKYMSAPFLSQADFLNRVRKVQLHLYRSTNLDDVIAQEDLWLPVVQALNQNGIEVDTAAEVALNVGILRYISANTTKRGGEVVDRRPVGIFFVEARFDVAARVYRAGEFYHLNVAPADSWSARMGGSAQYSRTELTNLITTCVQEILAGIKDRKTSGDSAEVWRRTLWSEGQADKMFGRYVASRRSQKTDLERWYSGVTHMSAPAIDVRGGAENLINKGQVESFWASELNNVEITIGPRADWFFAHDILSRWNGATSVAEAIFTSSLAAYYDHIDVISFYQNNVVYELNGELARGQVVLASSSKRGHDLKQNAVSGLSDQIQSHINSVVNESRFRR